jgi:hypothetical protein
MVIVRAMTRAMVLSATVSNIGPGQSSALRPISMETLAEIKL